MLRNYPAESEAYIKGCLVSWAAFPVTTRKIGDGLKTLRILVLIFLSLASGPLEMSAQTGATSSSAPSTLIQREETYPNGKVKARWSERNNADGSTTKHGWFENYYDNGKPKTRVEYVEGKEHGLMSSWQNNGTLISTLSYKHGLLHGVCTYFDSKGRRMSSGTYRDGKEDGAFTLYYPSGKIQGRTHWKAGVQHGKFEVWWENGKRAKLGQSKNGLVDGLWKVWDSTGALTLEETYRDGVMIEAVKHDSTVAATK